jgi:hypothetical protein
LGSLTWVGFSCGHGSWKHHHQKTGSDDENKKFFFKRIKIKGFCFLKQPFFQDVLTAHEPTKSSCIKLVHAINKKNLPWL